MPEYRIEFSIQRQNPTDDDYAEIGFGSSGVCADVDQAAHTVQSLVQNREWETERDMPDPETIDQEASV